MAASELETENLSAKMWEQCTRIYWFWLGGGRDDQKASKGLQNMSCEPGKQLGGFVMRGPKLRSSMNLG